MRSAAAYTKEAAISEVAQIKKLIVAGVKYIVVLNAPNIGLIPETSMLAAGLIQTATTKQQRQLGKSLPKITSK